ncbi:unnamed protein product, partial [Sphacelaria rigidula]
MAWKAERARRGIINGADRELDKAARQMANEAVNVKDNVGGSTDMTGGVNANMSQAEAAESQGPLVSLGRTVFRGEKFFWRTKDLIEIALQLNAKAGFMALSSFNTHSLEVYPIIFI